jgi:ethanolamine utilization protein EutN
VILGRVVGEVWATRKHPRLGGYKLLVVRPYWWYEPSHRVEHLVAIDAHVDAGVGDDVVVCMGEPPRWKSEGPAMPVEAAIMAVVDHLEIDEAALTGPRPLALPGGGPRAMTVGRIRTEPLGAEGGEQGSPGRSGT